MRNKILLILISVAMLSAGSALAASWDTIETIGSETPAPGATIGNDFGKAIYANKGDCIEVTFCGSIKGNASIRNIWWSPNGSLITLFDQSLDCSGTSWGHGRGGPVPATWKPFVIKSLYKVAAGGDFLFLQRFVLTSSTNIPIAGDGCKWRVLLFGRTVSVNVFGSAIESGATP